MKADEVGMILVDTTLLIDLQRSRRNVYRRDAEAWLEANPNEELGIPAIVLGEFAEGFACEDDPLLLSYRSGYRIVPVDAQVALKFGVLSHRLRLAGEPIGFNDTWIAATAVANGLRLLSRNACHFDRVPELEVVVYGRR